MPLSPFFGFERDPFTVMRRLQDEVDRAFTSPARAAGGFPAVNMWQGTDSAALTAELPGVDPPVSASRRRPTSRRSGTAGSGATGASAG